MHPEPLSRVFEFLCQCALRNLGSTAVFQSLLLQSYSTLQESTWAVTNLELFRSFCRPIFIDEYFDHHKSSDQHSRPLERQAKSRLTILQRPAGKQGWWTRKELNGKARLYRWSELVAQCSKVAMFQRRSARLRSFPFLNVT